MSRARRRVALLTSKRKMVIVLTDRPTDGPTTRPPPNGLALREHMRIQSVARSVGRSLCLSVCLNECWKGMDMATAAAAACATLGERDIILNGMVLTAAIRCTLYGSTAMPMNSVDCEESRESERKKVRVELGRSAISAPPICVKFICGSFFNNKCTNTNLQRYDTNRNVLNTEREV